MAELQRKESERIRLEQEMRAVAMMQVIDVKMSRGKGEFAPYVPKEWEYQKIARETGVSAREIYTMFVSPPPMGVID